MIVIVRQIWGIEGIGGKQDHISLTTTMKNAIMNQNGIKIPLKLLVGLVRKVRVCPVGAVEIEWEFNKD